MSIHGGRVWVAGGNRPGLVKRGAKFSTVVFCDGCRVRCKRVRGEVEARPLPGFDLATLAQRLLQRTNALGLPVHITRGAERVLREAAAT